MYMYRRSIRSVDRYRTARFRGIGLRSLRSNRASEAWELSVRYGRNRQERTTKRACLSFADSPRGLVLYLSCFVILIEYRRKDVLFIGLDDRDSSPGLLAIRGRSMNSRIHVLAIQYVTTRGRLVSSSFSSLFHPYSPSHSPPLPSREFTAYACFFLRLFPPPLPLSALSSTRALPPNLLTTLYVHHVVGCYLTAGSNEYLTG